MVTIVENTWQNTEVGAVNFVPSHETFLDMINNPTDSDHKEAAPAMVFASFGDKGTRSIDNVIEIDQEYFGIDIDDGMSIVDFYKTYKDFQFYLYTTHSHTKGHNKFRVIFKGSLPAYDHQSEEERRLFREYMIEEFPFIDKAALGPERLLYAPVEPKSKDPYVKLATESNKAFEFSKSWKVFTITKRNIAFRSSLVKQKYEKSSDNKPASLAVCLKQPKIKEYMETFSTKDTGNGNGEQKLWSALNSLKGMNACEEAWQVVKDHAIHSNGWQLNKLERKLKDLGR